MSDMIIPIAKAVGVTSSMWLSGYIAGMTIYGMPSAATAGGNSAPVKLWRRIYDIGLMSAPPLAVFSASAYSLAAIAVSRLPPPLSRKEIGAVYGFSAAAVTVMTIVPWTILMIVPTNEKLDKKLAIAKSKGSEDKIGEEDPELTELLYKWGRLNGVRSLFPLVAAVTALWAAAL